MNRAFALSHPQSPEQNKMARALALSHQQSPEHNRMTKAPALAQLGGPKELPPGKKPVPPMGIGTSCNV